MKFLMKNKAFFFDRDGIINHRLIDNYVIDYKNFIFFSDFFRIFKLIKSHNYLAIIITNQQGIGKGLMTENDLINIHSQMQSELFSFTNHQFDDIYYCPDLDTLNSFRRKPNPGMIFEAIEKWNIDESESFMIGDSISDVIAGKKAELKTILMDSKIEINDYSDYIVNNHSELYSLLYTLLNKTIC